MHYVMIEPYRGLVTDCTVPGCTSKPTFVTTLDGSNAPGDKQVACRSHIGDVAGNQIKRAVPPSGFHDSHAETKANTVGEVR